MKTPPTKAESEHMSAVAELGCLICHSPAQIHHVHGHAFGSKSNWRVVPLCHLHHHQGAYGECVHMGTKTFEANYMTQAAMLTKTNQLLGLDDIAPPVTKILPRR